MQKRAACAHTRKERWRKRQHEYARTMATVGCTATPRISCLHKFWGGPAQHPPLREMHGRHQESEALPAGCLRCRGSACCAAADLVVGKLPAGREMPPSR